MLFDDAPHRKSLTKAVVVCSLGLLLSPRARAQIANFIPKVEVRVNHLHPGPRMGGSRLSSVGPILLLAFFSLLSPALGQLPVPSNITFHLDATLLSNYGSAVTTWTDISVSLRLTLCAPFSPYAILSLQGNGIVATAGNPSPTLTSATFRYCYPTVVFNGASMTTPSSANTKVLSLSVLSIMFIIGPFTISLGFFRRSWSLACWAGLGLLLPSSPPRQRLIRSSLSTCPITTQMLVAATLAGSITALVKVPRRSFSLGSRGPAQQLRHTTPSSNSR